MLDFRYKLCGLPPIHVGGDAANTRNGRHDRAGAADQQICDRKRPELTLPRMGQSRDADSRMRARVYIVCAGV